MDAVEYVRMAELQDRHWWFEAKRRTVAAALDRFPLGDNDDARALEVGPGTGSMVEVMTRHGRMCAADAYLPALQLLVEHGRGKEKVEPVGADLQGLPFADGAFDLIGCFDVLYHQNVGDVGEALQEMSRVCAPGGVVAITDSAFPILRSSHDVATHGARRFRLSQLTEPLEACGFRIEHATYFHTLLFPAALTVRLAKRALHGSPAAGDDVEAHSDLAPVAPWLNAALLSLYRLEIPMTCRFRMPFGSSLLIVARRTR